MYSALPDTNLMDTLNGLESLREAQEHLRAFWDTVSDLSAMSDCTDSKGIKCDFRDLYDKIDAHIEQRIASLQAEIKTLCPSLTKKTKPTSPFASFKSLPY